MLHSQSPNYDQLPILQQASITTPHYVMYDELVLDIANFEHPGTNKLLRKYQGMNIDASFTKIPHSFNAKLFAKNLAIARTSNAKGNGYQLFREVETSQKYLLHEEMVGKLEFTNSLNQQLAKLSVEEKQAFVSLPKFYEGITLKVGKGNFEQFFAYTNFWTSHYMFVLMAVISSSYLMLSHSFMDNGYRVMLFTWGAGLWTLLEYAFHRFQLHAIIQEGKPIHQHLLHHAFPNFPYLLALSLRRILPYYFLFYFVFVYLLSFDFVNSMHFNLGLHVMMIMYDALHYYFHFGPELDVPVLRELRKNHLKHHYRNEDKGFGVTNTFWDYVFGTQHPN